MEEHVTLVMVLVGGGAGFLGAMLGLGGGVFLVPLLTILAGVPMRVAVVTSLISVIATASAAATVGLRRGLVNVRLGLVLEIATTIGAAAGGLVAWYLTSRQLFILFGATLAAMGVLTVVRSGRRNLIAGESVAPGRLGGQVEEHGHSYVYRLRRAPVGLLASLAAGALAGLLGLGGGVVKVPVLNAFCGIPIRVAAATSTFMIGVTASAAAIPYLGRGEVVLPLAAAVSVGALPGSLLGSWVSERMPARALKLVMAAVLLVVGARMALEGLWIPGR